MRKHLLIILKNRFTFLWLSRYQWSTLLVKRTGTNPDSKVHGANMGPIWGRQDPGGPHVGPMNFAIWEATDMSTRFQPHLNRVHLECNAITSPERYIDSTFKSLFSILETIKSCWGCQQRKHQRSALLTHCEGNPPVTWLRFIKEQQCGKHFHVMTSPTCIVV